MKLEQNLPQIKKEDKKVESLEDIYKLFENEFQGFHLVEHKKRAKKLEKIDEEFFNKDLIKAIKKFDIDPSKLEWNNNLNCYEINIKEINTFPKLPEGYAYKGGVARALLYNALGIDNKNEALDLDIIRLSENEIYEGADRDISKEFMPDDYANGYGVEVIKSVDSYMKNRDLTLNELFSDNDKVYVSEKGLSDIIRRIIRATDYEKSKVSTEVSIKIPKKNMAKMVRLYADSIIKYDKNSFKIDSKDKKVFERNFIDPFHIALHLDKAFHKGEEVALAYVKQLKKLRQIDDNINTPDELAQDLANEMVGNSFYYRHAPFNHYRIEEDYYDSYSEEE